MNSHGFTSQETTGARGAPPRYRQVVYNGTGLPTPRGSGTNGYVQRNLSTIHVKHTRDDHGRLKDEMERQRLEHQLNWRFNADILEHQRKRQVEVKCAELQNMMEKQGCSPEEIEEKVNTFRRMLQEKQGTPPPPTEKPVTIESHALTAAVQQKICQLREAFGIGSDYVDGSSFHPDRKKCEMEKREQERLERERLQQQQQYQLIEDTDDSSSAQKQRRKRRKEKNKGRDRSGNTSHCPRRNKKKKKKKREEWVQSDKSSSEDEQIPAYTQSQWWRSATSSSARSRSPTLFKERQPNAATTSAVDGWRGRSPDSRGHAHQYSPDRTETRQRSPPHKTSRSTVRSPSPRQRSRRPSPSRNSPPLRWVNILESFRGRERDRNREQDRKTRSSRSPLYRHEARSSSSLKSEKEEKKSPPRLRAPADSPRDSKSLRYSPPARQRSPACSPPTRSPPRLRAPADSLRDSRSLGYSPPARQRRPQHSPPAGRRSRSRSPIDRSRK